MPPAMPGDGSRARLEVVVRSETSADCTEIFSVTVAAFAAHPYSHQTEQYIIDALRAAGALTVSLVAEVEGKVAGHVAFSPVTVSDGATAWYGLGPVSVLPDYQRQGIGKVLIEKGLARLKILGAKGCVLVGDPGYYRRFGFTNLAALVFEGVPQEYFLALSFTENVPRGVVLFHQGFAAKS